MTYEITLNFYYQTFDNFKQKQALILEGLLRGSRLIDYARFHCYGIITPNGHKADKITIEELEKFNRTRVNCIIYNLTYNKYNPGVFDKLFIYITNTSRDNAFYGYILYNSTTGKMSNKYIIDNMDDKLCQYIYNSLINISSNKLWSHYSKKYDAVKQRHGLNINDIPTVKDYKEMKQYYNDFIKKDFNPNLKFTND
jgi:hypothetical protein